MKNPLAPSYGQIIEDLTNLLKDHWRWPSPEAGFALHVSRAIGLEPPFTVGDLALEPALERRLGEAPILAALGYVLERAGQGAPSVATAWGAGFARLATKQAFPRDRESFFFRPVELLGICLGVRACAAVAPEHRRWLERVMQEGVVHVPDGPSWGFLLGACAAHALGLTWRLARRWEDDDLPLEELALLTWLPVAYPDMAAAMGLMERLPERQERLLSRAIVAPLPSLDLGRAAVLRFALETAIRRFIASDVERAWQVGKEERDAIALVRALCARFHLFALQIQQRHDRRATIAFDDEYDVQDALHALLKLHFDDVRAEEWTPSYAGSASRIDFLLKREQIVIEAKMTRKGLGQKELANQLIIDKERYRAHPDCKTLICFVYDPHHQCPNPAALEDDVGADGPPLRVLVVVAPSGV